MPLLCIHQWTCLLTPALLLQQPQPCCRCPALAGPGGMGPDDMGPGGMGPDGMGPDGMGPGNHDGKGSLKRAGLGLPLLTHAAQLVCALHAPAAQLVCTLTLVSCWGSIRPTIPTPLPPRNWRLRPALRHFVLQAPLRSDKPNSCMASHGQQARCCRPSLTAVLTSSPSRPGPGNVPHGPRAAPDAMFGEGEAAASLG